MSSVVSPVASADTSRLAEARQQLRVVARSYARRRAATVLLPAAAGGLLLGLGAQQWPQGRWALEIIGLIALAVVLGKLWPLRRVAPATIAPRLDRQFAALEDSTGLLLHPPAERNLLEQLQQQRVAQRLHELGAARALGLPVPFRRAMLTTVLLLLASAGLWFWPASRPTGRGPQPVALRFSSEKPGVGAAPARIISTRLWVLPPAYTRQPAFAPAQASFQCPQGSRVRWQVQVSGPPAGAPLLELGNRRVAFRPVRGQAGHFVAEQIVGTSLLYRLRYGGTVSDDYAIDARPDQAPVVRIQTPKAYTLVAFGNRPQLPLRAIVRDDYGLSRAELVITVATGQGEAVKFREVRRDLSAPLGPQPPQATLSSQLDLPKLGLTYGDELYFYVSARDNAGHAARTDAYLVQWEDTTVTDSPSDRGMGIKVAPAYFRSQRQIIIDTEKLLVEKPKLDAATLSNRANNLGLDQQTLRLRYGKFMGEEAEAGIGAEAPHAPIAEDEAANHLTAEAEEHHDHASPPPANASPTDALMEPYTHQHDDAETADFLEPAVKAKLRAVLDQMWAAELRLRTNQLAAALPYEYRALRLLKQVQQQTRVFVKKAGFVPPPLPEATLRLTGELAGAAAPHRQQTLPAPAAQPTVRAALRWLVAPRSNPRTASADAHLLEQAGSELARAALQRPTVYLPALRALRQLVADVRTGRPPCPHCRPPIERAFTDLLAPPPAAPLPPPPPDRLARRYFQELNQPSPNRTSP
ncbi:hypothetical protein IC235_07430 [Hymenobacter sp. BT664]|uniref:DUF4175 family protein n=1 Tax=Hymenobacter montanus TaxID=2771359 RepID=A0A927BBI6_9BACT|nr:hypothetical protein [Hymenobacter montanus]MBD2767722.1 hypothetical protein [Hymenobacter montanus]